MTNSQHTMPGDGLPQALFDVVALLEARVAVHFRGTGLHWGLRRILQQLWIRDGLSQAELADAARISQASASNMLKHLIKGDWVERRPDEYDYRISRVYLADRGRELRAAVEQELASADAMIREQIGSGDAEGLDALLSRVLDILRAESEQDAASGIQDRPSPPGEL
ncbi:MAG: MarR family transcriptional regulator [Candidatus Bipolaricaulia bacterium]